MSDQRVETWASKQYVVNLDKVSNLLWSDDPEEGIIVCMSQTHANIILGITEHYLTWPGRWKSSDAGKPGDVATDIFITILDDLQERIINPMGCQGDLTRIAVAVEGLNDKAAEALEFVDAQYISLQEFISFLDFAGLDKFQPWLDASGELLELFNVIPDFNIKLPVGQMIDAIGNIFRHADFKSRLEHIHWALQANNLGQAGPGIKAIFDALLTLVPDPLEAVVDTVAGPVNELVETTGIDLITLLSRNYMTARTNDVARALNGGDYDIFGDSNVVEAINSLSDVAHDDMVDLQATQNTMNEQQDEWLSKLVAQVSLIAGRPECGCPAGGTQDDAPPVDPIEVGDPGYPSQNDLDLYRCKAAYITWRDSRSWWAKMNSYSVDEIAGMSLGALSGVIVTALITTGIGIPIAAIVGAVVALATAIATTISFQMTDIIAFLDDMQAEIICALFAGPDEETARASIQVLMDDYEILTPLEEQSILILFANNVLGRIYAESTAILDAPDPEYDCSDCFTVGECPFTIGTGSGLPRYDGAEWVGTAASVGGGVYVLEILTDAGCLDLNWCTVFTFRSTMNNTSANYTRKLYSTANGVHSYNFEDFDWNSDPADCFPDLDREYPISGMTFASDSEFAVGIRFIKTVVATDFDPSDSPACDE